MARPGETKADGIGGHGQRIDVWLWHARIARTRGACQDIVATGLVRINRVPTDKPHARVRAGDVLTVPQGDAVLVLRVVGFAQRRGTAADTRLLYEAL